MATEQSEIVFLVGNQDESRRGYAALVSTLGLVCESHPSVEVFLARADLTRPGCAIVDSHPRGLGARGLVGRLAEAGRHLPVIMVNSHWTTATVVEAIKAGVFHVLKEPCGDEEVIRVVQDAIRQCRQTRDRQQQESDLKYRLDQLHPRERAVLDLIVAGYPNKALQRHLRVSRRTVERDRAAILEKMRTLTFIELATTLTKAGVARDPERVEEGPG